MKIKPFAVEEWMNEWEVGAKYNIAETCVDSVSLKQLLEICGEDEADFAQMLLSIRLSYGDITGMPKFKAGVCNLY